MQLKNPLFKEPIPFINNSLCLFYMQAHFLRFNLSHIVRKICIVNKLVNFVFTCVLATKRQTKRNWARFSDKEVSNVGKRWRGYQGRAWLLIHCTTITQDYLIFSVFCWKTNDFVRQNNAIPVFLNILFSYSLNLDFHDIVYNLQHLWK